MSTNAYIRQIGFIGFCTLHLAFCRSLLHKSLCRRSRSKSFRGSPRSLWACGRRNRRRRVSYSNLTRHQLSQVCLFTQNPFFQYPVDQFNRPVQPWSPVSQSKNPLMKKLISGQWTYLMSRSKFHIFFVEKSDRFWDFFFHMATAP